MLLTFLQLLHFFLELCYYFGSSAIVIARLFKQVSIWFIHLCINLFWLTIYGTPALLIIAFSGAAYALRWLNKRIAVATLESSIN